MFRRIGSFGGYFHLEFILALLTGYEWTPELKLLFASWPTVFMWCLVPAFLIPQRENIINSLRFF